MSARARSAQLSEADLRFGASLVADDLVAWGFVRRGVLVHASPALRRLLGLPDPLPRRLAIANLLPPEDAARLADAIAASRHGAPEFALDAVLLRADGTRIDADLAGRAFERDGRAGTLMVVHDTTAIRREARELARLAMYDALTGLPNRALLHDRARQALAQAARRGRHAALLVIDLDGFKALNDRLGHAAGDTLLQDVGRRLAGCVRDADTAARQGGDEFALVLADVASRDDAALVAGRGIRRIAEGDPALGLPPLPVGASIGIALFPGDGDDIDTLLARADAAMYRAKANGRNRYAFAGATREMVQAIAPLAWTADRDTGIELVDAQHRELVDRMNRLVAAVQAHVDPASFVERLATTTAFLRLHFATEEAFMSERPGRLDRAHREEHRRILADLECLAAVIDEDSIATIVHYLYDWLFRHIDSYDREIGH